MAQEIGSRERTLALMAICGAALSLLLVRSAQLQVFDSSKYGMLSRQNRLRRIDLAAPRGLVLTADSVIIAESRPGFNLVLFATADWAAPVSRAASLLALDSAAMFAAVTGQRRQFPRDPVVLVRDLPPPLLARIEEHLDDLPGLRIETASLRRACFGPVGSHLLGFTGRIAVNQYDSLRDYGYGLDDFLGKGSLEQQYENILRGSDGYELYEVDARGRERGAPQALEPVEPVPGSTLRLSIDWGLQLAAESLFAVGQKGAAVAIEPSTGRILALVSRPNFDPNQFATGIRAADWNRLANDPDFPMWDRAVRSAYPPGSTFKVVTAAAALEESLITADGRMPRACGGSLRIGNRVFKCWDKGGHGSLDLHGAMVHSCDVYFYQLGLALTVERMARWSRRMGLGDRTRVDLPIESPGLVPDSSWYRRRTGPGSWRGGVAANMAIGQGELMVTPLQLASLYGAIGNDGQRWKPHLLVSAETAEGAVFRKELKIYDRLPLSPATIAALKRALADVVNQPGGTGGAARVAGVAVAGKTGTAQNPHGEDHSWFACFAPADRPSIAVAVLVENAGHGSAVAAPIAGSIVRTYLGRRQPRSPGQATLAAE
ncbi:MAG: penicillin-binding protein 2 [Candidatus Edwardsbacteria bacterium]|jgi:penicillin-binding protein 2|nr:penicillin-binding protein 2 [Candidatus Edwardsbacteria bacterium]